jgi:hypothetical protein
VPRCTARHCTRHVWYEQLRLAKGVSLVLLFCTAATDNGCNQCTTSVCIAQVTAVPRFELLSVACCLQSQLAALVSKCKGAEDLDYFLLEAASLVGLNTPPEAGAKVCILNPSCWFVRWRQQAWPKAAWCSVGQAGWRIVNARDSTAHGG